MHCASRPRLADPRLPEYTQKMQISVVIPTHQRAQGLEELLRSLSDQDFPRRSFEVHVVSNFKDDPSFAVVHRLQSLFEHIQWHYTGQKGSNRARNLGLKQSRGEIVAYFDDDCVVPHRSYLSEIARAHAENVQASAIGGGYFAPIDANAAEIAYNHIAHAWLSRRTEEGGKFINLVGGNVSYKRHHLIEKGFTFNDDIVFGGAETEMHLRMFRSGLELIYLEHLKVEHRARLNGVQLVSKGYKQGLAMHKRWGQGLHVATRLPANSVIPQLPPRARLWKDAFERAFIVGSDHARTRGPMPLGSWAVKLIWRSLFQQFKRQLYRWSFGGPERPTVSSLPLQRFFVLPISNRCVYSCSYCASLGCKKTTEEPIENELKRAKMYGFNEVLLPCNATFSPNFKRVLSKISDAGLKPTLLINGDSNAPVDLEKIKRLTRRLGFHLLLAPATPYMAVALKWLKKRDQGYTATYFHHGIAAGLKILRDLPPELANRVHYLFSDETPIPRIHRFLLAAGKLTRANYQMHLRPAAGFWPVSVQAEPRKAFPLIECDWSSGTRSPKVEFSVIIPTYESGMHLLKVLRSLREQSFDPSRFEVLIMDDGSQDGTLELIRREGDSPFHLRYFYWPRSGSSARTEFRAGLIRNLGASKARGEFLCFLDSDILVPPDYLSDLERRFDKNDVIQARRDMLSLQTSRLVSSYQQFHKRDTYAEDSYWESFKALESWSLAPYYWKYTCTYALSLRKDLFMKAGWFSPEFFNYGYEDVDLGYRLYKLGARFHLSQNAVYHLYPERSEFNYHFDHDLRSEALARSARVFFRSRLDPEVYQALFPSAFGGILLKIMKPYFFTRYQYEKRIAGPLSNYLKGAHAEN